MEKTSKTFGQRFLAVLCALTMLFTLCPQGAFAAAPETGSTTSAGGPQAQESLPPQEPAPAPTESSPAPTPSSPAPTESGPAPTESGPAPTESGPVLTVSSSMPTEDPDGGSGIMLMTAATDVEVTAAESTLRLPADSTGKDITTTVTAKPISGDVDSYSWDFTGTADILEFDGGTDGPTVTVKAKKAGTATVRVTCAVAGAPAIVRTCEIEVKQQYYVKDLIVKGNLTYGGNPLSLTVETQPGGVSGITAQADPEHKPVERDAGGNIAEVEVKVEYDTAAVPDTYEQVQEDKRPKTVPVKIYPRQVTLTGLTFSAAGKTYDGKEEVPAALAEYTFGNIVPGDELSISNVKYRTNEKDADPGVPVTVIAEADGTPALGGKDAGNYELQGGSANIVTALAGFGPTITIEKRPATLKVAGTLTHTSNGDDHATKTEIEEQENKGFTCAVEGTVPGESLTAKVTDADIAAKAWTFAVKDLGTGGIEGVKPDQFTITEGPSTKLSNYELAATADVSELQGTISARPLDPKTLDTTDGTVTLPLTDGVSVMFDQGALGADGSYWYSGDGHGHAFGVQTDGVALYTASGPVLGAPFTASDLTGGERQASELYIKTTAELGDAATGTGTINKDTIFGPVTVTYNCDKTPPAIELTDVARLRFGENDPTTGENTLKYTITVSDTAGSGINTGDIWYGVAAASDPTTIATDAWQKVTPAPVDPSKPGIYTITVTASARGYLYVKANDFAGNEATSEGIHPLVVENHKPTVKVEFEAGSPAGPVTHQGFTWSVDETHDPEESGAEVTEYSGIATVTVTLLKLDEAGEETVSETILTESGLDNTQPPPTALTDLDVNDVKAPSRTVEINDPGLNGKYKLKVTAKDFCGNGNEATSGVFTLDNTGPNAVVAMANVSQNGGTWYYNATNCGLTVTVTDAYLAAAGNSGPFEVTLTDAKGGKVVASAALTTGNTTVTSTSAQAEYITLTPVDETEAVMQFAPEALETLEDGKITVTVVVKDRAGNPNEGIDILHSTGVADGGDGSAVFVLDTTPPQVTGIEFSIDSKNLYPDDGNYYSNRLDETLTFTITDTDSRPLQVTTGYTTNGTEPHEDAATTVESDGTAVIEMRTEADYAGFYIKGKDLAGNPLTLGEGCKDKADYDAATGKITVKNGVIIDRTPPEATITYKSEAAPGIYPEDGYAGGGAYYNKKIEAEITVQDEHLIDDTKVYGALDQGTATTEHLPGIDENTVGKTFTIEATKDNEGGHFVTVHGTDRAGNPLTVTENEPGKTSGGTDVKDCDASYQAKYLLVLDITDPTAVLALLPDKEPANPGLQTFDKTERYYFNTAFQVQLTITDKNLAVEDIDFKSGKYGGTGNFATEEVSPNTDVTVTVSGDTAAANPNSNGDGVYIYSVSGTDKAGNKLKLTDDPAPADGHSVQTRGDGSYTTYAIVVDTQAPETGVAMNNANGTFYKATLNKDGGYAPSLNMPYQKTDRATVTFTPTDNSPTQIKYTIDSTIGDKANDPQPGAFSYAPLPVDMVGQQYFSIAELAVTDMAGNVSRMTGETNHIYLDVEAPDVDELAPTVQLVTTHNGMGRGPDGVDLYDGTVTVRALVRDPNAGVSASGLYEVHYKVLVDNANWTDERVGTATKGTADGGLITYRTGGPTFNEGDKAFDQDITTEDDITFTFPAETFNYNDIYIYVWAQDNSGNELTETNAAFYHFGIDVTEPTIQVTYDNNEAENEKYFKADRTATIVVTERNFDPDRTEIRTESQASVGGWSYAAGGAANGDDDTWTCEVVYSVDGDYTFDVTTTDQVGHTAADADYGASVAPKEFTIDKTDPVITVTFNNNDERNGRYYNAARTATILVEEHNFDAGGATVETTADIQEGSVAAPGVSGWSSAGDDNTATVAFLEDGDYTMDVTYTDLAGNEAEPEHVDLFTVDTTAPELEIGGVEDHVAYNGEVAPSITYHDINYDNTSAQVTITGYRHTDGENLQGARTDDAFGGSLVCDNIPAVRENDDVYTATGFVSDLAGNTSEATIVFSVNRFGSTYMLSEQTRALVDGYYTNQPQELHVTEINVSKLVDQNISVSLNGSLSQLRAGTDYTVQESAPGWMQYDYAIHAANFDREGAYTVTLYSEDDAANTNTNQAIRENDGATNTLPIEFLVDMTAPVTIISGVEDNERYVDTERTLMVYYSDNTALAGLSMYIGSDRVADYSAEDLRDAGGQLEYIAKAANDWQTLRVTAVDVAGNSSEIASGRFLLTDNLWVQYINNTPLVIGSVGGICLLFLLILLLLRRRRKEEE